ncbi:MAG: type II toxin-antitoxin system VapC family toxin [Candidatus Acidulodesulfobacterium ferriphilum]|jgi:predicted nucleic-acid-binding protein|uniref:Type II toxin-antitoxin system VapC family toxin n=1 Tax=Candidatus Acidulodesulfobacterium ferriphilum TaxID=2597223 RepID=A0A519BBW6_9DELT|nr:MAG: type II toxin-antitoxin system VapC family toxin [Candidatus Acidulodesulfobacterium ferriphilum]
MRFADTNIFLRYLTNDDAEKAKKVFFLLKRVEEGKEKIITSPLVIFELIFTLEKFYKVPRKDIKEMAAAIINLEGLAVEFKDVFIFALKLFAEKNISFADAFNASIMKLNNMTEIYSYDTDFDKIEKIKRIEP